MSSGMPGEVPREKHEEMSPVQGAGGAGEGKVQRGVLRGGREGEGALRVLRRVFGCYSREVHSMQRGHPKKGPVFRGLRYIRCGKGSQGAANSGCTLVNYGGQADDSPIFYLSDMTPILRSLFRLKVYSEMVRRSPDGKTVFPGEGLSAVGADYFSGMSL